MRHILRKINNKKDSLSSLVMGGVLVLLVGSILYYRFLKDLPPIFGDVLLGAAILIVAISFVVTTLYAIPVYRKYRRFFPILKWVFVIFAGIAGLLASSWANCLLLQWFQFNPSDLLLTHIALTAILLPAAWIQIVMFSSLAILIVLDLVCIFTTSFCLIKKFFSVTVAVAGVGILGVTLSSAFSSGWVTSYLQSKIEELATYLDYYPMPLLPSTCASADGYDGFLYLNHSMISVYKYNQLSHRYHFNSIKCTVV